MTHRCAYEKQVQRMRRHREELELALAENLTLDQARERLASYRAHAARLAADSAAAAEGGDMRTPPAAAGQSAQPFWWQRD